MRSNVGYERFWRFEQHDESCMLDGALNADAYLHGDFSAPYVGPDRADLIAFASRATRFVERLAIQRESDVTTIDAALAKVAAA